MTKLTKDFYAVPTGEIYPRTFEAGSECPADLIEVAASLGILEGNTKPKKSTKVQPPLEKKG